MANVYLDTSFFSACVSERSDAASIYRRDISREWWLTQRAAHGLFVSPEVVRELKAPTFPHRDNALTLTKSVRLLDIDDDTRRLARVLVRERVMPGPEEAGDALHVAISIVHRVEYFLTWNVRHLANVKKVAHLRAVSRRIGYGPPELITPDLLWGRTLEDSP